MEETLPERVRILKNKKVITEGGAENKVFDNGDNVIKVSKGNISRINRVGLRHYGFNIDEKTPNEIRVEIINEYLISKVLNILFRESVPNRSKLFSKFYPMYEQKKVKGVWNADDVEMEVKSVSPVKHSSDTPVGRLMIKLERIVKPTKEGEEKLKEWQENAFKLEQDFLKLGIIIDRIVGTGLTNFIKTPEGNYVYIDTFSVSNLNFTKDQLLKKAEQMFDSGFLDLKSLEKVKVYLRRLIKS
jgi:hypothetical protein